MKRSIYGYTVFLPYLLILAVAIVRLAAAHPYNFVPVFSVLVFFGACRPAREFAVPLLGLVGLDLFLTTYQYGFVVTSTQGVTWLFYLAALSLGAAPMGKPGIGARLIGAPLLTAVIYFVASNFVVWAAWGMYPMTWGGLGACYAAALPFFRNSIVSEAAGGLAIYAAVRLYGAVESSKQSEAICG